MPDGNFLFGVQRSSDLILCTPDTLHVVRAVPLAGRHFSFANPVPFLRRFAPEIWALDYDTLVRVDYRDWQVTGSVTLQPTGGFGRPPSLLWMTPDETHVVIARPFSADVTILDVTTMTTTGHHRTRPEQPLEAATLPNNKVIARDLRTGEMLLL
jgi:hypothetical protein